MINTTLDPMMTHLKDSLKESEERFKHLADSAPVMIWTSGLDKLCNFFNKPWLEFSGRPMEAELGNGWAEKVHPDDFDRCLDIYVTNFDARKKFTMDYRMQRHDGEYRWILDNGIPRYSPMGEFIGFIGSCVDITDRKIIEMERDSLLAHLQESLKARDEFLSIASHELNTPITSLKLKLQMLQHYHNNSTKKDLNPDKITQFYTTANSQVDALASLVTNLLDVSKINSTHLELEREYVDVSDLVLKTTLEFSEELKNKGITLNTHIGPNLKASIDAFRFRQVVTNLLSNAIKYGANKPIEVSLSAKGNELHLSVIDKGIGIDISDHARIFNRFERAVSPRNFGGLGLGLFISQRIIEAHNGRIEVESQIQEGSHFSAMIPMS